MAPAPQRARRLPEPAGVEACPLPPVPLKNTVDDAGLKNGAARAISFQAFPARVPLGLKQVHGDAVPPPQFSFGFKPVDSDLAPVPHADDIPKLDLGNMGLGLASPRSPHGKIQQPPFSARTACTGSTTTSRKTAVQELEILSGILMMNTHGGRLHRLATNVSAGTPLQGMAWKRRAFELRPVERAFFYWQTEEAHEQGKEPEGHISLAAVDEVAVKGREISLHFAIPQPTGPGSSHTRTEVRLRADTCEEAERWGQALLVATAASLSAELPNDWDVYSMLRKTEKSAARCVAKLPQTGQALHVVQRLMDQSFICKRTRDRRGLAEMPMRLEVVDLMCIHNVKAWIEYRTARDFMAQANESGGMTPGSTLQPPVLTSMVDDYDLDEVVGLLEERANEQWLFHGAPSSAVQGITDENWRLDLAGSNAGVLYGKGIYLAECSSKADEYADEDEDGLCQMLLCRASLGRVLVEDSKNPGDDIIDLCKDEYDSLCGDRWSAVGSFREFIVYSPARVYPAYIITYRRVNQQELLRSVNDPVGAEGESIVPYIAQAACTHHDKVVRHHIFMFLQAMSSKVVPVLLDGLTHRRWPVRRVCALAIGLLCDEEYLGFEKGTYSGLGDCMIPAMKLLTECLEDPQEAVQKAAGAALGKVVRLAPKKGDKSHIADAQKTLVAKVKGQSLVVRKAAIKSLGYFGAMAVPAMPALIHCLHHEADEECKRCALETMANIGVYAASAVQGLVKVLSIASETQEARSLAAVALGQIGKRAVRSVPALTEALKDGHAGLRTSAATSLGQLGEASLPAVQLLAAMEEDPSEDARKAACKTLGLLLEFDTGGEIVRHLSKFMKNESAAVRGIAAASFVAFGTAHPAEAKTAAQPAFRTLAETIVDDDPNVRKNAIYALGKCGVTGAISKIRDRLKDRCEAVAIAANTALMDLGDRTHPTEDELVALGLVTTYLTGKRRISSTDELAPLDYEILERFRKEGRFDLTPSPVNPNSNGFAAQVRRHSNVG